MSAIVRTVECECGETLYTPDTIWDSEKRDIVHVWACCNCGKHTHRQVRQGKTNASRAHDAWTALKAQWTDTDDKLVANGTRAYYLYSSFESYHMRTLTEAWSTGKKLSHSDLKYHIKGATEDLEKGKAYLATKQEAV
jgi:hypothetical protein